MSSGVISIGPEHRVVIMNRRAEEILGMAARDVLNRDLRALPSPLGDLLFETLSRGRSVTRSETQLADLAHCAFAFDNSGWVMPSWRARSMTAV